jgi:hypothetical protein
MSNLGKDTVYPLLAFPSYVVSCLLALDSRNTACHQMYTTNSLELGLFLIFVDIVDNQVNYFKFS